MQVFKAFMKIAQKRLKSAMIYFAIYMGITLALSATTKDFFAEQFQASSLTISVTDEDNSTASEALVDYLSSIHQVTDLGNDKNAILDRIYYRSLSYALTIPDGFEEKLLNGDTEELLVTMAIPGTNNSQYVDQQISQYLKCLELYLTGGYTLDNAIIATNDAIAALPAVESISFYEEGSSTNAGIFYYFQYLPYIFIVMLFAGLAPILITLNGTELKARTMCSSMTSKRRTAEMTLGCILYSLGIWLLFLILCFIVYGAGMVKEQPMQLAVLNSFVFMLFTTVLTLLISSFQFDDNILNMAANMIGLSMAFLCGVFVPQSMLPASVLNVAKFLPAYWYIRANNMLAGFGNEVFDMDVYLQCIGIQLLYVVAIFAVAVVISRQTRRR